MAFGFFLVTQTGLLGTALESDRSYISYVILAIYAAASVHWMLLSYRMSGERDRLTRLEQALENGDDEALTLSETGVRFGDEEWTAGDLSAHLRNLLAKREAGSLQGEQTALNAALGDTIANRHSSGHFASDVLLKLGLLGTMVGFILMLAPVAAMHY